MLYQKQRNKNTKDKGDGIGNSKFVNVTLHENKKLKESKHSFNWNEKCETTITLFCSLNYCSCFTLSSEAPPFITLMLAWICCFCRSKGLGCIEAMSHGKMYKIIIVKSQFLGQRAPYQL